jgi:hypothetical protein
MCRPGSGDPAPTQSGLLSHICAARHSVNRGLSALSVPPSFGLTLNKKVATMLAEILMVRLETALRMAKEAAPPRDPRFVPFTMTARSELNASGPALLSSDAFAAAKKTTP